MKHAYDVIVVGARCAGSPTAMQLARRGRSVLMVDRATFPSDTVSTHIVHPLAASALERWGLLARLVATGCPPIPTYSYDFGPFTIEGPPGTRESPVAFCPRRTVLDRILVEAAVESGVELREGFTVEKITMEGDRVVGIEGRGADGNHVSERAEIVVGADGRFSRVADGVEAESYRERGPILAPYYTYYSGLPMNGRFETYIRPNRGFAAAPTHDGLTLVIAAWPFAEFDANRHDVELHFNEVLALVPEFDARVRWSPGSELLPQAVRPRLGARGRRRIQQGPDHGARNLRRVHRLGALRRRDRRFAPRSPFVRRSDESLPAGAR